jgi:hypothetical protein
MTSNAVWFVLMYLVLPLWVGAGFLDYICHRRAEIEKASGPAESAFHWLLLGEVGIALLAAVFLKIDALIMVFMGVCLIAHEITSHLDLQLAIRTRNVTAFEQQVHSVLEMMPLSAMLLVFILHWPQAQALFGAGTERADWSLTLKEPPTWWALAPPAIASFLLLFLPYLEEFIRGSRAAKRGDVRGGR